MHPLRDDPFALLGHYATPQLRPEAIVAAVHDAVPRLEIFDRTAMMSFAAPLLAMREGQIKGTGPIP